VEKIKTKKHRTATKSKQKKRKTNKTAKNREEEKQRKAKKSNEKYRKAQSFPCCALRLWVLHPPPLGVGPHAPGC
jgi:hypothetical protein